MKKKDKDQRYPVALLLAKRDSAIATFKALKKRGANVPELVATTGFSPTTIERALAEMLTLEVVDFRRGAPPKRKVWFLTHAAQKLSSLDELLERPTWR